MLKDLGKILFGFLCAFLAVGMIKLVSDQPYGIPIQLTPPPSPAPLFIHVSGAVKYPGVYQLKAGSRVWDAVQMAGGFLSQADQESLNLAEIITDGSRIYVPTRSAATKIPSELGSIVPPVQISPTADLEVQVSPARIDFPIDINTASAEELELLPQIGQVRAARIVAYRERNGYFKKVEDVRNVYDISPEVFAAIRDLITASQPRSTLTPPVGPTPP